MENNWKTIVLMALNGGGVNEPEALMQIRVIEPMMEMYLKEELEKVYKTVTQTLEPYKTWVIDAERIRKEERNAVLSEVEKEVYRKLTSLSTTKIDYLDKVVLQNTRDELSTIINNLRVK